MAANQTTAAATFRRTCVCQDVCWLLCNFPLQLHRLLSPSSCIWISPSKNNNFLKCEFVDLKGYPYLKIVVCSILLDFALIPAPKFSPPLKSPSIGWQQNSPSRGQRGIHLYMEGRRPLMETCSRWCNWPYGLFHMGQALLLCLTWIICLLFWKVGAAQILCWPRIYRLNCLKTLQCMTDFYLTGIAPSRHQQQQNTYCRGKDLVTFSHQIFCRAGIPLHNLQVFELIRCSASCKEVELL